MNEPQPQQPSPRLPLVGGLFRRLLMHHVVLVTVPILVLGLLLVGIAQHAIRATLQSDNREITLRVQGQIEGYASYIDHQLRLAATALEQFALDPRPSDRFLNEAKMGPAMAPFRQLYLVDGAMDIVATTDFEALSRREMPLLSLASTRAALQGRRYVEPVRIEQMGGVPTVFLSTPLQSYLGEIIGAVVAEVDIRDIWLVIDTIQIGEEGRAFLVDAEGVVIAHRDKSLVYNRAAYRNLLSVQRALAGELGSVSVEMAPGSHAMPMMATYAPVRAMGLDWGLIIHRPLDEIQATTARMRWQIVGVIAIGMALALLSTLVYTRRLVQPIGALVDGANRLSRGDLSYKIPVAGRDELGKLAIEFNLMAEGLLRIQERLRRVEHLDTLAKFSSVVAHEIRNPLNAMQINLRLLEERLDPDQKQYLDIISSEIRRLENLVREFQTISRPPVLSPQPTDVNRLLADLVKLQQGTADAQAVVIETVFEPDLPQIEIDRNRITQAVLNLVINTFQAMPDGGTLTLRTGRSTDAAGGVFIEVTDTGEGIPDDHISRVFDYYYTSRDRGSGLGLSITQQIVDEHGGRLVLRSRVGEGTSITLSLLERPPGDHRIGTDVLNEKIKHG